MMKKKTYHTYQKRIQSLLLAFLLLAAGLFGHIEPVKASSGLGTVTFAVERFTIGQGYLIEPIVVEIQPGDDYSIMVDRVFRQYHLAYTGTGQLGRDFYLASIKNADTGRLNIPTCIQKMQKRKNAAGVKVSPPDNKAVNTYAPDLSEFSYNNMSGWWYFVNNKSPQVGLSNYKPKNGDVFRLQFTIFGYGADLTGSDVDGFHIANKDALTAKVAQVNQDKEAWFSIPGCKASYEKAMKVLLTFDASQEAVDTAYHALPQRAPVYPKSLTVNPGSLTLYVNDMGSLTAVISPNNVDDPTIQWSSSNEAVASVNGSGVVTGCSAGKADITAETVNGIRAVCHVTVQERKLTAIFLNRTKGVMEAGQTLQLSVVSYEPANATEKLSLSWTSSAENIASVDAKGLVTARNKGSAVVTARTSGGITAQCQIMVKDAKDVAEEFQKQLQRLPDSASSVNWDNAAEVLSAYEEYQLLSDAAKSYLPEESIKKLEKLVEAARRIQVQQEHVRQVTQCIRALPSPANLTLADEAQVQEAKAQYDRLEPEEKERIAAADLEYLNNALRRIKEQKQELAKVQAQIEALPETLNLDTAADVLDAADAYYALNQSQKEQLAEVWKNRLAEAETAVLQLIKAAVNAVPKQKFPGLETLVIQNFIRASVLYDRLDVTLSDKLSKKVKERLLEIREQIGSGIHTDEPVTVDTDWFVQVRYKGMTNDASLLSKIAAAEGAQKATTILHGNVAYTDIRTGADYELKKVSQMSLTVPKNWAKMKAPVLYQVSGDSITRLNYTYDEASGKIRFQSAAIGEFLLAELIIPLTGILLPAQETVGKNSTIMLQAKGVPENATDELDLVWKSQDKSIATVKQDGTVKGIREGKVTITASLKANSSIQASCTVIVTTKANQLAKSVSTVLKQTKNYMLSVDTNPTVGSEWFVLGLARYGLSQKSAYFDTYYNHIANYLVEKDGNLGVRYTEYSKLALVMTAIGKDARDVAGYNLFSYLSDYEKVCTQGINGPIFALIASNANPAYDFPQTPGVAVQTTKELLIDTILKAEVSGGGWSLAGDIADSDMTGMALQALAPYYNQAGYEEVTAAIERGLNVLSAIQDPRGGYAYMGVLTSESSAQVLTALCALGVDPQKDARFIKNGHWVVEDLLTYQVGNSGFMHVQEGADNNGGAAGGQVNGMATEQAFYALVAYQRFLKGDTALYDMSDMKLSAGENGDGNGTGVDEEGSSTPGNGNSEGIHLGDGAGNSGTGSGSGSSGIFLGNAGNGGAASADAAETEAAEEGWNFTGDTYQVAEAKEDGLLLDEPDIAQENGAIGQSEEAGTLAGFQTDTPQWPPVLVGIEVAVLLVSSIYRKWKMA